jgi:hypothetical protein
VVAVVVAVVVGATGVVAMLTGGVVATLTGGVVVAGAWAAATAGVNAISTRQSSRARIALTLVAACPSPFVHSGAAPPGQGSGEPDS